MADRQCPDVDSIAARDAEMFQAWSTLRYISARNLEVLTNLANSQAIVSVAGFNQVETGKGEATVNPDIPGDQSSPPQAGKSNSGRTAALQLSPALMSGGPFGQVPSADDIGAAVVKALIAAGFKPA